MKESYNTSQLVICVCITILNTQTECSELKGTILPSEIVWNWRIMQHKIEILKVKYKYFIIVH